MFSFLCPGLINGSQVQMFFAEFYLIYVALKTFTEPYFHLQSSGKALASLRSSYLIYRAIVLLAQLWFTLRSPDFPRVALMQFKSFSKNFSIFILLKYHSIFTFFQAPYRISVLGITLIRIGHINKQDNSCDHDTSHCFHTLTNSLDHHFYNYLYNFSTVTLLDYIRSLSTIILHNCESKLN